MRDENARITNANLADQDQQSAVVLENFWPTETGIEPRGGTKHRVSVPSGVKSLFARHFPSNFVL
jgi:hypothetical protein